MTTTNPSVPHPLPLLLELFRRAGGDDSPPTGADYSAGFIDALSAVAARPEEVMAAYYDWLRTRPHLDVNGIVEDARDLIDNDWHRITEDRHDHDCA